MKNSILALYALLLAATVSLTSCETEGCMDPMAVNYYKAVTVDDGSCSYSTTRMIGDFIYTWQDSVEASALVSPEEISYMKVLGDFDHSIKGLYMIVDWKSRTMFMPDSITPQYVSVSGRITDQNAFTIDMVYDSLALDKDTSYLYEFIRI
jgi:hypothetical protein